jgi:hypothetical protein
MPGKTTHLSPLASRKQLLIAESELNRARLTQEWRTMTHGVGDLAHRAKIAAAWGSAAALLAAGVTAWRRGSPARDSAKSSWLPKILNGARVASMLWLAFRGRGEKGEPQ